MCSVTTLQISDANSHNSKLVICKFTQGSYLMKIFVYSLVAISVLCTSDYSFACSIPASAPPQRDTEDDQVRRADLIVIGKVIEIQKAPDLEPKGYASRLKISVER